MVSSMNQAALLLALLLPATSAGARALFPD
jgi:hypothetical protein